MKILHAQWVQHTEKDVMWLPGDSCSALHLLGAFPPLSIDHSPAFIHLHSLVLQSGQKGALGKGPSIPIAQV